MQILAVETQDQTRCLEVGLTFFSLLALPRVALLLVIMNKLHLNAFILAKVSGLSWDDSLGCKNSVRMFRCQ